ncbi:pantetheine-phosphate adenylyltransferase [archaeon]|nr:pantetheine-phosphate adenylyltransferase [archaeon]
MEVNACLGGTFNNLHEGHKKLIETAFKFADSVLIGLSSDEFAKKRGKKAVSYEQRKQQLEQFLSQNHWQAEIIELNDPIGPALEPRFNAIIVSEETRGQAEKINQERINRQLHSLTILTIPMYIDDNGDKLSSSLLNNTGE